MTDQQTTVEDLEVDIKLLNEECDALLANANRWRLAAIVGAVAAIVGAIAVAFLSILIFTR